MTLQPTTPSDAMVLDPRRSLLILVDAQERLIPAMAEPERVVANAAILLAAAERLGIPILVTEQYPKGLGPTVPAIAERLPASAVVMPKTAFSAAAEESIAAHLDKRRTEGRDQAVVCGVEAHVCVLQTALHLKGQGWPVTVVGDAVSSRSPHSVAVAEARLLQAGCVVATTEMALFEWMQRAGTDSFKALSALVRDPSPRLPPR